MIRETQRESVFDENNGQMTLVLEAYEKTTNRKPELRAFDIRDRLLWTANFPRSLPLEPGDSLTAMSIEGGRIFVNTWNCWRFEIEPNSGIACSKTFTK